MAESHQIKDRYMSASRYPGRFGATVFNELFRIKNINAVYSPEKFEDAGFLAAYIRNEMVKGCGISTPLKFSIIEHLDRLDPLAEKLGSVNTVTNTKGILHGYNTDWYGAEQVLRPNKVTSARILGSGGVVPALIYALQLLGVGDIEVVYRNPSSAKEIAQKFSARISGVYENFSEKDVLINAVPTVGDENNSLFQRYLPSSQIVFDLVVKPTPTALSEMALKQNKHLIQGYEMAMYQLIEQFRIYFGQNLEADEVLNIIQSKYLNKN